MELLRPKDRERILNIRGPSTPPSKTASPQAGPPVVSGTVSSGLQQEALAAWKGTQTSSHTFRPFEKNPSKQARYDMYLTRLKQGDRGEMVWVTGSNSLTVFLALLTVKQTAGECFLEETCFIVSSSSASNFPAHIIFERSMFLSTNVHRLLSWLWLAGTCNQSYGHQIRVQMLY